MGEDCYKKVESSMNFKDLELSPTILESISEMGFETPTQVQSEVIPLIMEENDLIVMAKTGSGKTGAFGLPMLHMMEKEKLDAKNLGEIESTQKRKGPVGLILTPTRELAVQVDSDIQRMSKYMELKTTAVYGQHNMDLEIKSLNEGVSIVTGTPGRVNDHLQRKTLLTQNIKFLVLDEADRMLDMGFYDQVMDIIKTLPKNRITLLFSATMPAEIKKICREYMKHPVTVELDSDTKTVDTIRQIYHRVDAKQKRHQLERVLRVQQPDSCMVFCNTRHEVDKVTEFLQKQGFYAKALHGAKDQNSRMKTINSFRDGKIQILVATDVAARGIHIDDLTLVINYDVPDKQDSYVHRIGRTGRAGNGGLAICLVTTDDIMSLYELEVHVGCLIEEVDLPTDAELEDAKNAKVGRWADNPYVMSPSDYLQNRSQDRSIERGQSRGQGRGQVRGQSRGASQSVGQASSMRQSKPRVEGEQRKEYQGKPQGSGAKPQGSGAKIQTQGTNQQSHVARPQNQNYKQQAHVPRPQSTIAHKIVAEESVQAEILNVEQSLNTSVNDSKKPIHHHVSKKQAQKTDKYSTKYMVIDRTQEIKDKKKAEKASQEKGLKKVISSVVGKLFKK